MAKILIVDDSAVTRKSLREIVTGLGHIVVGEVASGSQAFVQYIKLKPDVVMMDLTMQGMSGAEATSKIIATYREARIIVISAIEERRVVIDALERGARHFIIKPINREKVAAVVDNVLKQEYDLQSHIERVRKLKKLDDSIAEVSSVADPYSPPYFICAQGGNLVQVVIGKTLTLISCQSLALELTEYLTCKPRVLFDFGAMLSLDQAILIKLNQLVETIENSGGVVRAISNNKRFVDSIGKILTIGNKANLVGNILRYYAT